MPTREVRARAGDPRALPAHRQALRPLRQRAASHTEVTDLEWDDDAHALDHPHQPRRRVHARSSSAWAPARCTCRSCRASPASRPSRATRSTPAAGTTTTPAATRRARRSTKLGRQAGRHHRHRRHRRAVRAAPRARLRRSSSSSSARRRRSTCATTTPIDPEWFARSLDAGLAAALAGELHHPPDRRLRRRGPGAGRLDRHRAAHPRQGAVDCRASEFTRRDVHGGVRGLRLREDGGDPRPGRRDRRRPRDGREAQALVPPALQAAVLPRRVPARPSTSPARTWSTPTARASSASPRPASWARRASTSSTASSTRRASRSAPSTRGAPASTSTGRGGVKLSEHWADGMRTLHGIHVHGFPNAVHRAARRRAPTSSPTCRTTSPRPARPSPRSSSTRSTIGRDGGRGHRGGRGRLGRAARAGAGAHDRTRPTARPATTTTRASRPAGGARSTRGLPGGPDGLLPVHRRLAQLGRVRGPGVPLKTPKFSSRCALSAHCEENFGSGGLGSGGSGQVGFLPRVRVTSTVVPLRSTVTVTSSPG